MKIILIKQYLTYFFIFNLIGWIWEVLLHLHYSKRFVNRGMLHGPWIPIYGCGGLLIIILLKDLNTNSFILFILSGIICGTLEYLTSLVLEKLRGTRWWDYTDNFLNIKGRVCLSSVTIFGLAGVLLLSYILPSINNLIKIIDGPLYSIILSIITLIFTIDLIYSNIKPNRGNGISKTINQ